MGLAMSGRIGNYLKYLITLLVLASPIQRKPLVLYIIALDRSLVRYFPKKMLTEREMPYIPQPNTRGI